MHIKDMTKYGTSLDIIVARKTWKCMCHEDFPEECGYKSIEKQTQQCT